MNDNPHPRTPAEQVRTSIGASHATFSRRFKAQHDADTQEMILALKVARHRINVLGGNTDEITALLKKHGA